MKHEDGPSGRVALWVIGNRVKLIESMELARAHLAAGATEQAAAALDAGAPLVPSESDRQVLLAYAAMCHDWAASSSEETALRRALALSIDLEATRRLLDILQGRLNELVGARHRATARDCIGWGEAAMEMAASLKDAETFGQLRHNQGLRHLELARQGEDEHAKTAALLLGEHLRWLESGDGVPAHWPIENHRSAARVDLAEALLALSQHEGAAKLLDAAIAAMERAALPEWMTARARRLLEESIR